MKFGMTSLTFRAKNIEETVEIAKRAGVECIEWGVSDGHVGSDENIGKIKKLSKDAGIEICSLGSYCYLEDEAHCIETVEIAAKLSAPVIRVWAGKKSPFECDEEYFNLLVSNTQKMADAAAEHGIVISFEYHHHSLTETAESAIKFIKAIGRDNVKTHWQPSGASVEDNKAALKAVAPCLSGIFHVQNYVAGEGYLPVADIKERVKAMFEDYKNSDFCLLVEFTKDSAEENLVSDLNALKEVL